MRASVTVDVQDDRWIRQADLSGTTEGLATLAALAGAVASGASLVVECAPRAQSSWPAHRDRLRILHSSRDTLLASLTQDALVIEAGGIGWLNLLGALDAAADAGRRGDGRWHQHFEHVPGMPIAVAPESVALIISAPRGGEAAS